MSDPTRPTAKVTLDRERTMALDMNALANAEEVLGKSVLDEAVWKAPSARDIRALLWACLKSGDDPDLTLEQAGALVYPGNIAQVSKALGYLAQASFAEPEEGEPKGAPFDQAAGRTG